MSVPNSNIAAAGHSPTLLKLLAESEQRLAQVDAKLAGPLPKRRNLALTDLRNYVASSISDLRGLHLSAGQKAKSTLAHHIKELTLTPQKEDGVWVYQVRGEWQLLPGKERVIWMVARDGIEPPTPAFSGPRSTTELPGLSEDFQLLILRGVRLCRKEVGFPNSVLQRLG